VLFLEQIISNLKNNIMAETAVVTPVKRNSKKEIRNSIQEKLSLSLADYRSIVGEKRFESRIRKTARRFGEEVAKALPKKLKKVKKNSKEKSS
jgi:hypothetical protein